MKKIFKVIVMLLSMSFFFHDFQVGALGEGRHINEEDQKIVRVLLITGSETLLHQFNRLAPSGFYQMLYGFNDIVWDHALSDESAFNEDIRGKYDVVIFFSYFSHITGDARKNLYDFIESGKGVIAFHSAAASYNDWDWWWEDVIGMKYQYEFDPVYPKSKSYKPESINMIGTSNHPIPKGVGDFNLIDETYKDLVFSDNEITVLYKTDNPNSEEAVVWIGPHKKSRVIVIQPGHGRDGSTAYTNPNFKRLLHESIIWSSGK